MSDCPLCVGAVEDLEEQAATVERQENWDFLFEPRPILAKLMEIGVRRKKDE